MRPDTIAALATAGGRGAVAMVRLSGPDAPSILHAVAPGLNGTDPADRRATLTRITDPADGSLVDQAVVVRYAAPSSYTGEHVVEISCHGGRLAPALVLEACRVAGARLAEPGEFTRRAYLNGKLDLVQVEAIADVVSARSRALHRASMVQLERGLSSRVAGLRERLIRLEAFLAHHLDFPEEDDAPVPIERILDEAQEVIDRLDHLLATAPEGEMLREGAVAVLAGRPNAGKSSLYNALIGEDRALVTEVPGTTRDALEAAVELGGYPFRLVDTAGLRDTSDTVEALGIEVARRALARADLVLLCTDGDDLDGQEADFLSGVSDVPVVVVHTKVDLRKEGPAREGVGGTGVRGVREAAGSVSLSVVTGEGLPELRELLTRLVYRGLVGSVDEVPVVTRRRHARALRSAREGVSAFRRALVEGVPAEMASTHLRPAETALEEMLGVISVDDVLDVVFSTFCVGK